MLNFYDFEVFAHDWLVVIINPVTKTETVIINDRDKLQDYYDNHKNEIWIGYNSSRYDQYILKGILCGFDPKKINDFIIVEGKGGWSFSQTLRKIPLINYDVSTRLDGGLKSLEGFMGNDIRETTVDFKLDRKLTNEEIQETITYCRHDVEQTIEVFLKRKNDFDAHMGLIKAFKLPLHYISKTKAQLSAIILNSQRQSYDDEFEISFPSTMKIEKYKEVVEWYKNPENRDYSKSLKIDVAGIPHQFGWGGIHGAITQYYGEGYFLNMDVASLYPSLMIVYGLGSRSMKNPKKYEEIYHARLKYKHEKNPLQAPLKIVLNGTYGAMKDKNNGLYDPRQCNNVCVYGQLLLLDLIEKLEPHCQIIQSNTDGILIKMRRYEDYDLIDDICYEWEKRTGLQLEFDEYRKVIQKDVNNYVIVDAKGKYKSKGAYVKKLGDLDYDLPIVNKAVINYLVYGIPVDQTINDCDDLKMFQKIVKVSSKYMYGMYGNKILTDKCFRVFASRDPNDPGIFKRKNETKNPEKFANTPDRCFIANEDINDKIVDWRLDKSWYIDLTNERLRQFGVI